MSLMELIEASQGAGPILTVLGIVTPVLLYGWVRLVPPARVSRGFGQLASTVIAVGLICLVVALLLSIYLHNTGTNLVTGVSWATLIVPWWFGLGNVFAVTRYISFSELREYPMLRRVWALLSAAGLVFAAFLVLRHTYWLVFSGVMGFLIVAVIAWTAFQVLFRRGTEARPDDGDPEFVDGLARRSKERIARLSKHLGPNDSSRKP
ncbi:MAG: hypothetical protein ACI9OJ_001218 [Myxococcota bacterium]|jgi:hypothetical protein